MLLHDPEGKYHELGNRVRESGCSVRTEKRVGQDEIGLKDFRVKGQI